MPQKESEAVPERNGLVPQQEEFGSDQPTLAGEYRIFGERFEGQLRGVTSHLEKMDELSEEMRATEQRLADLEQDA